MSFGNRDFLGFAVGGACRGEHDASHSGFQQSTHESHTLFNVVLKIARWLGYGFTDVRERREMDAGFYLVLADDSGDELAIADVAVVEGKAARNDGSVTAHQVVEHDDLFASIAQQLSSHAANVPGSTGDKDH